MANIVKETCTCGCQGPYYHIEFDDGSTSDRCALRGTLSVIIEMASRQQVLTPSDTLRLLEEVQGLTFTGGHSTRKRRVAGIDALDPGSLN